MRVRANCSRTEKDAGMWAWQAGNPHPRIENRRLSFTYDEHREGSSRCGHRVGSWIKGSLRFLLPITSRVTE